jgi:uncharacterized protein (TIGR03067 family)
MLVTFLLLSIVPTSFDNIDNGQTETKKELAKFEGIWEGVGGEEVGHVLTREAAKDEDEQFIFKGDRLTVRKDGKVQDEFKISVDPSKNPKEMDLHFIEGKYEGKKCLAIYTFEGDQLKICTETKLRPSRGGLRPNVFSTQKNQDESKHPGLLLFVLERRK